MTFLFVDTNVLLHFKRLEEIDWLKLSGTRLVTILLCPTVIRELDRQKSLHPQHKIRKRSQEITSSLHRRLIGKSPTKIRDGVDIHFIAEDPSTDFTNNNLRPEINDDWIIASAIEWKQIHSGDETKIVTADLGLTIKSRSHGIEVIAPLELDRHPEVVDGDEKKILQLQRQLAKLQNSIPVLNVAFSDKETISRHELLPQAQPDPKAIDREIARIKAKHPALPLPTKPESPKTGIIPSTLDSKSLKYSAISDLFTSKIGGLNFLTQEKIVEYNSKLERFYKEYEHYINALHCIRNTELRSIEFSLIVENQGSCPADEVDIHLHFPDGFQLFEKDSDDIPNALEPPSPPKPLNPFGIDSFPDLSYFNHHSLIRPNYSSRVGPPPNVSSPTIRRTNSYDVDLDIKRAKHGYIYTIGHFIAVFDSYEEAKSFTIEYSITASNLPNPSTGRLSVVISKPDGVSPRILTSPPFQILPDLQD